MTDAGVSNELDTASAGRTLGAAGWGARAAGQLNRTRRPIAQKLRGAAEAIREQAQALFERESISVGVSDAAHGAAERVESSADYLELHDVAQIGRDAVGVVKRNPVPALLAAAAVGYLLGRALRKN